MLRARSGGDARFARRAVRAAAEGWARVAFRGTPYPTLLAACGRARVVGLLLTARVPVAATRALRAYEGRCYRLVPLHVATARGPRAARAFAVPPRLADQARPWSPPSGDGRARGTRVGRAVGGVRPRAA